MVDKVIGELPSISSLDDESLFVAEQNGQAVKVSGKQLTDFANVETATQVEQAKASAQAAKTAQDAAEAAILKSPIIQNGTWWVYNQTAGAYQDTGIKATGPQGIPGPTSSVNGISPDDSGNIALTAGNVNAYSKTESDNLLQEKANASSVYTKSETYTKEETNTLLQKKADKDRVVNPNILDNWYFANPVDQRGGYVTCPGHAYNSEPRDGTVVGILPEGAYYKATYVDQWWHSFEMNGVTYYQATAFILRGYVGKPYGYTIDRWRFNDGTQNVLLINDGYVTFCSKGASQWKEWSQLIENYKGLIGKTITYSALVRTNTPKCILYYALNRGEEERVEIPSDGEWRLVTTTVVIPDTATNATRFGFQIMTGYSGSVDIKAAKLELGSQQTLAHQDENGNWQLNELPNYADTLARCQRYALDLNFKNVAYQTVAIGVGWSGGTEVDFVIPTPVTMRANPVAINPANFKCVDTTDISWHSFTSMDWYVGSGFVKLVGFIDASVAGRSYTLMCDAVNMRMILSSDL